MYEGGPGEGTAGGAVLWPLGALVEDVDVTYLLLGVVLQRCKVLPEATSNQQVSYCRNQHK